MRPFPLLWPVLLSALVFSSAGAAAIVPQHSIAGVSIGMSEKQIRAKLGPPSRVRTGSNDFGPWRQLVYRRVLVSFQGWNEVTGLRTTLPTQRTAGGLGVGSTLAQLRKGLTGETCRREFGVHHCWVGRWDAGRIVTDFRLEKERVSSVSIARVID